jgi:hypothetical protein
MNLPPNLVNQQHMAILQHTMPLLSRHGTYSHYQPIPTMDPRLPADGRNPVQLEISQVSQRRAHRFAKAGVPTPVVHQRDNIINASATTAC